MGFKHRAALLCRSDFPQTVRKKLQWPLGGNARIELAHGTCGGVARVDEGFEAGFTLAFVQRVKVVAAHVHLAAHFQHGRCAGAQTQRNLPHGADVLGDVFTTLSVTARSGLHQHTVFVAQAHGQAVKLELGHVVHRRVGLRQAQLLAHTGVKVLRAAGFGVGLGADAEHGHGMAHRHKFGQRFATDPLCG